MSNEYSRMNEQGQQPPEIVTPPEPKCTLDNGAHHEIEGVPVDAETARLHAEAVARQEIEDALPGSPQEAQGIIDNLTAGCDRQARALDAMVQGAVSHLACLSSALQALGAIEAHDLIKFADTLNSLFFRCGQITEDIARLHGIKYEAPYSVTPVALLAEEGPGTVVAKLTLRPEHIDQRIAKAIAAK